MNDREFQKFLEESKRRNRHNGYSYTNNPTSYEVPAFTKSERKNIEAVIRSITPRDRFMPAKIEDLIIGTCRSFGRDNYHRKVFYLLRSLDEISSGAITNYLQRQATRLSHELPSDKYCANLATICMKVIETINHHVEVGNISLTTSEPDFEFDPYILEEF